MNCLLLRNIKIRNHPTWRLKEIENNWDWEGFQIPLFLEDKSAFVHLPGQRVSDRKAIEQSSSTKKFREHQMEILYLVGFKQTVYFDTGRLQGYPLCEIDFFHLLIGFSIRDWSIEMWEGLPQKLVTPKIGYPKKLIKKMVTSTILAYFIARGFIIAFRKNGVLYCVGVY